jgi:glycosyltransferase involved in cell wall biosynthesis
VLHFVHEILPRVLAHRPDAVLTIVGADAPQEIQRLQRLGVVVTGFVPDVRPYLARAGAVIAPLRMGGGTRIKILEAMAMGKAVITTSVGCEGIDVIDGEHVLVADEPAAFADAVRRVLDDASLASCLGRAGRALVDREYRWSSVAQRLEEFLSEPATLETPRPASHGLIAHAG